MGRRLSGSNPVFAPRPPFAHRRLRPPLISSLPLPPPPPAPHFALFSSFFFPLWVSSFLQAAARADGLVCRFVVCGACPLFGFRRRFVLRLVARPVLTMPPGLFCSGRPNAVLSPPFLAQARSFARSANGATRGRAFARTVGCARAFRPFVAFFGGLSGAFWAPRPRFGNKFSGQKGLRV